MQIFAQGLVGLADVFIHPSYISSVSPFETPGVQVLLVLAFCIALAGIGYYVVAVLQQRKLKRAQQKEALGTYLGEAGPPRGGP